MLKSFILLMICLTVSAYFSLFWVESFFLWVFFLLCVNTYFKGKNHRYKRSVLVLAIVYYSFAIFAL